jgi:hypothetical protein
MGTCYRCGTEFRHFFLPLSFMANAKNNARRKAKTAHPPVEVNPPEPAEAFDPSKQDFVDSLDSDQKSENSDTSEEPVPVKTTKSKKASNAKKRNLSDVEDDVAEETQSISVPKCIVSLPSNKDFIQSSTFLFLQIWEPNGGLYWSQIAMKMGWS